jgi:hypothetical protein
VSIPAIGTLFAQSDLALQQIPSFLLTILPILARKFKDKVNSKKYFIYQYDDDRFLGKIQPPSDARRSQIKIFDVPCL